VVQALNGLLSDFGGATLDLARLTIPPEAFGKVGTATARSTMGGQDQLVATLTALQASIRDLSSRVRQSAEGYRELDRRFADQLNRMTPTEPIPGRSR
jgi:hypothetical protein